MNRCKFLWAAVSPFVFLGIGVVAAAAATLANPYYPQFYGQCTWWAAEERADLRFNTGNADTWASTSAARGYIVDTTPEAGAIAAWAAYKGGAGSVGHVAYVMSVKDATHFHVSEYNWSVALGYDERDVTWVSGIQFIHTQGYNQPGNPPPPPPVPDPSVSYTYSFKPAVASAGTSVQVTAGAADTAGYRAVQAIRVTANGQILGTISGSAGSVTWNTANWAAGTYTVRFQAQLANWTGAVNSLDVNYLLQAAPSVPQAPATPQLSSPGNRIVLPQTTSITFNWLPATNAADYYLEYWGGPYSTLSSGWVQGTNFSVGAMWPGAYSWHVKARNTSSVESNWSETWTFTVQGATETPTPTSTAPPAVLAAPALRDPGSGASLPQSTDIWFAWNNASGAAQYYLEYWGGPYGTLNSGWMSDTAYHVGQMWPGAYSWHVKVRNASGAESSWSETRTFTILSPTVTPVLVPSDTPVPTAPPPVVGRPALSSPGNGSSLPQSTDITLVWSASTNATQYKVELWGGPYSTMTPCDWQGGTSCHIGQMWPGVMYWQVKARNSAGESDWSATWSFTIQDFPPTAQPTATNTQPPPPPAGPGVPSLSSPSNGGSYAQSTDITLSWNASSNATQYKVELWGGPYSTMTPCDWQSGTSCHIGQMWPGTMYWHVKARNPSGQESDWSSTWSFLIQDFPPTQPPQNTWKPTLSSPGNGALLPRSTDVTLSWNALDGATQYKVELWGGPYSRMTPCDWQSGTSCHIGQMWPGNMLWRVKARDGSGRESDWSDEWNFTIQN